jgi:hypothetical protein
VHQSIRESRVHWDGLLRCFGHCGDDCQCHSDPEQAEINRQIQRANGEARGVSSQDCYQWLRDDYADCRAGAAKQQAFG